MSLLGLLIVYLSVVGFVVVFSVIIVIASLGDETEQEAIAQARHYVKWSFTWPWAVGKTIWKGLCQFFKAVKLLIKG